MDIEWSKRYILGLTGWSLDESTFKVLDENRLIWVGRVTTTHLRNSGEAETSFVVLVRATEHFVIPDEALIRFYLWCMDHKEGKDK